MICQDLSSETQLLEFVSCIQLNIQCLWSSCFLGSCSLNFHQMLEHVHLQSSVILRVNVSRRLINDGSRKSPVQPRVREENVKKAGLVPHESKYLK